MSSIHVFVNFDGEWDDCNIYNGYSVCGLILPMDCTYNGLIRLLATALEKEAETHHYTVQYQAMQNGPRILISNDSSLAFYLGLKIDETDKRSYPLCVDVTPRNRLSAGSDLSSANGEGYFQNESRLASLDGTDERGASLMDLMLRNPTTEELGRELSEYIRVPNEISVDESVLIITQPSIDHVAVGNVFKNKDVLVTSINLFAIKNRFQFKVLKSDNVSYSIKCLQNSCNWTFRASRTGKVGNFKIRRVTEHSNCSSDIVFGNHRQASSSVIADRIKYRFMSARRVYTPSDVMEDIQESYGVTISYDKAWRSRELAIKMIRGDPEESYRNLSSYMYMLGVANVGTFHRIETDDDNRFLFSFIALGASIAGWIHCKPVIVIDGTFLTGRYRCTLFTACTQDANNNIFILAFGVGDAENNNAWEWFLLRLREAFGDREGLCIVSDRHISIRNAVENVYPNALHGACTYHLLQNLKKEFPKRGKGLRLHFNAAVRAYTITEFETHMRSLDEIDKGIRDYLVKAGFENWSRAHMTRDRYSTMTSNIVESVNSAIKHAKKYPIEALFECLRCTVQKWFFQNLSDARSTFTRLASRHNAMLNERVEMSTRLRVRPSSDVVYQVNDENTPYVVNMDTKTCSCRRFQLDHLPCPHAIAVISSRNYSLSEYCSEYFTKEKYVDAYQGTIYPVGNKEEWRVPEEVSQRVVLPPKSKRGPGRPRENRFKSALEYKKTSRCGRCDSYGHNTRTCRDPVPSMNISKKKRKRFTNGNKVGC